MEDRCVMCGEIIPEGRMVCPVCEERVLTRKGEQTMKARTIRETEYTWEQIEEILAAGKARRNIRRRWTDHSPGRRNWNGPVEYPGLRQRQGCGSRHANDDITVRMYSVR